MASENQLPPSVNYHINSACNYSCEFCYARFEDSKRFLGADMLSKEEQLAVVNALGLAWIEKITFAGGEPTLVPWLIDLIVCAKESGLTTMLVTNGSRLTPDYIRQLSPCLDWIVLSIDSFNAATNAAIGRAQRNRATSGEHYYDVAEFIRSEGIRLKMNTVVNQYNLDEDMSAAVRRIAPERWKLFQVLPIDGQNDGDVDELLISPEEFDAFVERHRSFENSGVVVVPETNDDMTGSYAMVDPAGRFFDNTLGCYTYSRPILDVGVLAAFQQVSFDQATYQNRGAIYDW